MLSRMLVPLVLVAGALLAGCTAPPGPDPTPTATPAPRPPAPADTAADMVGTWTLTDVADGMTATISLREGGGWEAAYECGPISGEWASVGNAFLATWFGGSMGCFDNIDPQPTLAWVENTYRVSATTTGWTLLDANGTVTATLSDGIWEGPLPERHEIVPLGPEFEVGSLEGRWTPVVEKPGRSFFDVTGTTWTGSDGCNGAGGKWVDLGGGYVIATPQSITTQIGCENIPVASWVGAARTAGFDGDELVLFDAAGDELGRLQR